MVVRKFNGKTCDWPCTTQYDVALKYVHIKSCFGDIQSSSVWPIIPLEKLLIIPNHHDCVFFEKAQEYVRVESVLRQCGREKAYEAAAIRNTLCYCVSEQDMSLWIHSLLICDTSVPNCVHVWAHGHVDLWAFQLHLMCLSVCLPFSDSVALYAFGQPSVQYVHADAQCTTSFLSVSDNLPTQHWRDRRGMWWYVDEFQTDERILCLRVFGDMDLSFLQTAEFLS